MKRHITGIIVLMSVTVVGIVGLQLFWNYVNYQTTVGNFDHDTNEALRVAVDREIDQRQRGIASQVARWMSDTSRVLITCDTNNRHHETVFHVTDAHPYSAKEKGISLSINHYSPGVAAITPEVKRYFVQHFAFNVVLPDLQKGTIYYYTQRLGDSLHQLYFSSLPDTALLRNLYTEELSRRGIHSPFTLNAGPKGVARFHTQAVNGSLRRPYEKTMMTAGFDSPDFYFIRKMKWVIITTLLLVAITVFCFAYTTKTLLSQHKLSELRTAFINNMTHELNTPLASIKITAEALRQYGDDPKTLAAYLDIIGDQTDKLTGLADQILHTNQLTSRQRPERGPVDLDLLIQEALLALQPQVDSSGLVVRYVAPDGPVVVRGDRSGLMNVLTNVLDNAIKYRDGEAPLLVITVVREGRFALMRLADNGPGIPEEYRETIFEPFFRVPEGNKHDVKGYGLGLSTVQQVIRAHGGSVEVGANPPKGSIFTLQLPLA